LTVRPIRNDRDYENAISRAVVLIESSKSADRDELEVLQALIEQWERRKYPSTPPTPVEAIRFRMQQQGLKPRDLEAYLGPRSRVSEILSGTRSLTVDMMRALHHHLDIPADVLLGIPEQLTKNKATPAPAALRKLKAFRLMWPKEDTEAFVERAFGGASPLPLMRKTRTERTNAKTDLAALEAWCAAVQIKAQTVDVCPLKAKLGMDEARKLAALSCENNGPTKVADKLAKWGVVFIALPHLPGTYLDGAAMCRSDKAPIIAVTVRHDRLDNFWFTVLHEFCHVAKHLKPDAPVIVDDLDVKGDDDIEREADKFAQDALIPSNIWRVADHPELTADEVREVAARAKVHPSIVAGRWQRSYDDYRRFAKLMVRGEIRAQLDIQDA